MNPDPTPANPFALPFDELDGAAAFTSEPVLVAARDVEAFAALTGDHHPAHLDPIWAADGPFGRPIAHGLLVLSQAVGTLPLDPERVIALRRLRDVVFKRPVGVGDVITVACAIGARRALDERTGLVDCACRIHDADGRLSVRAVIEVLWRREPASVAATDGDDEIAPVTRDRAGELRVLL